MKRYIQLLTGFHRIHSVRYSYGYKIPFLPYGIFDDNGFKKLGTISFNYRTEKDYHNCTLTNRY